MKSPLIKYLPLLALMAYIVSFLISASVLVPSGSASKFDRDSIKTCEVVSNSFDPSSLPVNPDDDNPSDDTEYCAGGCKYLLGSTFDCLREDYYFSANFYWKFHYQSPNLETLSSPPRAPIS